MKIRYTPEARNDIKKAKQYILNNFYDQNAADKLGSGIVKTTMLLKEQPDMGRSLEKKIGRKTDMQYLLIGKFIAFYRVEDNYISIIRILDTRTDYMNEIFNSLA